jgi:hypothetical protein
MGWGELVACLGVLVLPQVLPAEVLAADGCRDATATWAHAQPGSDEQPQAKSTMFCSIAALLETRLQQTLNLRTLNLPLEALDCCRSSAN